MSAMSVNAYLAIHTPQTKYHLIVEILRECVLNLKLHNDLLASHFFMNFSFILLHN